MSLPAVIHSQVDPAAITKVTRLFNNTLGDVLAELIQNARRAGATAVDIDICEAESGAQLVVADDGRGIADPTVLVALGRSGWDDDIARREDPAGMGVFSLAGRAAEISSRAGAEASGWRIAIAPDAWETGAPIAVLPCERPIGTEIRIALGADWRQALDGAAAAAARYCPVPIRLRGETLKQEDWLAGAEAVIEQAGVRVGLFQGTAPPLRSPRINFHGLTVPCAMPSVPESHRSWWARIDIVDAPELQLVLPARKEMVENAALGRLRDHVRTLIFRHIAALGSHRLGFDAWCDARDLGVVLPEAEALLRAWTPGTADGNSDLAGEWIAAENCLIADAFGPPLEQCAAFALGRSEGSIPQLVDPDEAMAGYSWYDALPHILALGFEIERDDERHRLDINAYPGLTSGNVQRLDLVLEIGGADPRSVVVPAPVAIDYDEGECWSVEDAKILLAGPHAITPDKLVDLLEGACFCASDERDADSWETQNNRFLLDAREMATRLLLGDDAALIERLRAVLACRAQWFVPEGRRFAAVLGRDAIDIRLEPVPAVPAA